MFKTIHFSPAQVENLVAKGLVYLGGFASAHGFGTGQDWQGVAGLVGSLLVWWFSHNSAAQNPPSSPPTAPPTP